MTDMHRLLTSSENLAQTLKLVDLAKSSDNVNYVYQITCKILSLTGMSNGLPRVVVFGQQSMGKTTLMDSLLGGPIGYVSAKLGTKVPIQIVMRPSETDEVEVYFDGKALVGQKSELTPDQYSATTTASDAGSSNGGGGDGGRTVANYRALDELGPAMDEYMKKYSDVRKMSEQPELNIEVVMPGAPHMLLVDLPGIKVDDPESKEITFDIVRSFISGNPNNIYVFVRKSPDDPACTPYEILELLKIKDQETGVQVLEPNRTFTVCTRVQQFIEDCIREDPRVSEMYARVLTRGVPPAGADGSPRPVTNFGHLLYPLYLVELFAMESGGRAAPYLQRQADMRSQLRKNQAKVLSMLDKLKAPHPIDRSRLQEMKNHMTLESFKMSLQQRLNALIASTADGEIDKCRRLLATERLELTALKKLDSLRQKRDVEKDIYVLVDAICNRVRSIHSGHYGPPDGEDFSRKYGRDLLEDLSVGNQWAMAQFANDGPRSYGSENFDKYVHRYTHTAATMLIKRRQAREQILDILPFPSYSYKAQCLENISDEVAHQIAATFAKSVPSAMPGPQCELKPGQLVRHCSVERTKDQTACQLKNSLVGYVSGIVDLVSDDKGRSQASSETLETDAHQKSSRCSQVYMTNFFLGTNEGKHGQYPVGVGEWTEHSRPRLRKLSGLTAVIPLSYLPRIDVGPKGLLGWKIVPDSYINLQPVIVSKVLSLTVVENPFLRGHAACQDMPQTVYSGVVLATDIVYTDWYEYKKPNAPNEGGEKDFGWKVAPESAPIEVPLDLILIDFKLTDYTAMIAEDDIVIAASRRAHLNIVNHMCFKRLSEWLEHVIEAIPTEAEMHPDKISQQITADTGIQDCTHGGTVLHSNVRDIALRHMIPLITLAVCTAGAICERIMSAGLEVALQNLDPSTAYLGHCDTLTGALRNGMHEYAVELVEKCRRQLIDAVADAWSTISFKGPSRLIQSCFDYFSEASDLSLKRYTHIMEKQCSKLGEIVGEHSLHSKTMKDRILATWCTIFDDLVDRKQKSINDSDMYEGDALLSLSKPHVWAAKVYSRQIIVNKLYHCFENLANDDMITLELYSDELRPPKLAAYLREQLLSPPGLRLVDANDRPITTSRALRDYYVIYEEDHASNISKKEILITNIQRVLDVWQHLLTLMRRTPLEFLSKMI